jgi:integrase
MLRPSFRLNTAGLAARAAGKRVKEEAPRWGTWVHRLRDATGKKVRVACATCTSEGAALLHNAQLAQDAADVREGRVTAAAKMPPTTWDALWASYLAARQSAPGLPGLESIGRHWFHPVLAGKLVRSINPALCLEVLQRAEREGLAPSTRRHLYQTGKAVFHHAMNVMEVADRNPWKKVTPPRIPKVKRPALSPEQAAKLLEGAGEHRLLFLFAVLTGCRRGEIAGLRWSDIHFNEGDGGVVYVARSWDRATTKGKETRPVPLHPVLREGLLHALESTTGELVFPSPTTGGMRSKTWHAAELLRSAAARAGVELPAGIIFHSLRRTFATLVHGASKDKLAVQRLLGHTDPRMTDVYLAHSLPQLEAAVAQLPHFTAAPAAPKAKQQHVVG